MSKTFVERWKIDRLARKKVGLLKQSGEDHRIFLSQCVSDMLDGGEASDRDEARDICEAMWEDMQDIYTDYEE